MPELREDRRRAWRLAKPDTAAVPMPALDIDGVRVLVVDDEAGCARDDPAAAAGTTAPSSTAASSAGEAMELLQREEFEVLVSDIGMPREDGYSLIRRVRALPPAQGGAIHAIALTAFARAEDRVRAALSRIHRAPGQAG